MILASFIGILLTVIRFRWVVCQLDMLPNCVTLPALRKALESLPKTLDETYECILTNIDESYASDVRKLLQFLTFSPRAMSLTELVDMPAIDVEGKNLNSIPKMEYLTQGHLNHVLNAGHDGRHHRIPNDLPAVGNLDNCQIDAFFCQGIPPFRPHQFLKSLYVQLRPRFRIYVLLIRYGTQDDGRSSNEGGRMLGMAERIADVYDYGRGNMVRRGC
jgi:hypothetical protein